MTRSASIAAPEHPWACPPGELAELVAELLARRLNVRMAVTGASMTPVLRDGDTVLVEPVGATQARFGDLILYRAASGALVLHRVLRVLAGAGGARRLQTRGDAALRLDEPVEARQVLGRVRRIERTAPDGGRAVVDLASRRQRLRGVATAAINLAVSGACYKLGRRKSAKSRDGLPACRSID